MATVVGCDIGGTKIAAGLVDAAGAVRHARVVSTGASEGRDAVLGRVMAAARAVIDGATERPRGVGLATAGQVDTLQGRVIAATPLLPGWGGLRLQEILQAELRLPVVVDNDVNAMAFGELRAGAARGEAHVLFAAVGTGIGGALVLDGTVYRGADGVAGELGHVPIVADGRRCTCGRRGCVEAYASATAITRDFVRRAGSGRAGSGWAVTWLGKPPAAVTLADVARSLAEHEAPGSAAATHVVGCAGRYLGIALGGLCNVLDPALVVVGGGVTAGLGEPFIAAVRSGVEATVLPPMHAIRVVGAALGADAALIGAGLLAQERFG